MITPPNGGTKGDREEEEEEGEEEEEEEEEEEGRRKEVKVEIQRGEVERDRRLY